MQEAVKKMAKFWQKYKEDFDNAVQPPNETIDPESIAFVQKKFYGLHDRKCKLAPATEGTLRLMSNTKYDNRCRDRREIRKSVMEQSAGDTIGYGDDEKEGTSE